jgi:hypothetical protein
MGGSNTLGFLNNSNPSQGLRGTKDNIDPNLRNQLMTQQKNFVDYRNKMLVGMNNPTQFKKGGKVSSASKRADGIATKGKTKGRIV